MNKCEFLTRLALELKGLPREDAEHWLEYYTEMLDDRVEDGMSEEEAVAALGNPAEIVKEILAQTSIAKLIKNKIKPKRKLLAWEIILICVGAPLWVSLAISAAAVFFSVFVSLWAVIVSLWATEFSLAVGGIGCFLMGCLQLFLGYPIRAMIFLGTCFVALGLSWFGWYLCKMLTVLLLKGSKAFGLLVKSLFVEKEGKDEK